jgi:Rieske Fe-S protein
MARKLPLACPIARRQAMGGIIGGALVLACGGDDSSTDAGDEGEAAAESGDETGDCSGTSGTLVGAETDFAMGTWKLVQRFIIAQDANGFFAYSAVCTHAGCVVDPPSTNGHAFCHCHGSTFDGNGNVTQGPALFPLQHFAVNICGGNVYVDETKKVTASTRTPPQ